MEGLDAMLSEQRHRLNVVHFVAYYAGFSAKAFCLEAEPFVEGFGVLVIFANVQLNAREAFRPTPRNGGLRELAAKALVTKLWEKANAKNTNVSSGFAHERRDIAPANDLRTLDSDEVRAAGVEQPLVERQGVLPRRSLGESQVFAFACNRIYDDVQTGQVCFFGGDDERIHGV
jgi:hypothetical protein